ncbi:hypothetical protein KIL84_005693 [Mauremys mutica]|uniref:Uncharacterized protein n=1 Tax=Mauremys mutica TaxID=74926 RepID=A0A9D3XGU0_9SAUR|nr:hypothetical protein KIL84_005693 [Mauremys mutica]
MRISLSPWGTRGAAGCGWFGESGENCASHECGVSAPVAECVTCCPQRGWAEFALLRASAPARDQFQLLAGCTSSFPALCLGQVALSSGDTELQCPPDNQRVLGLWTNVSLRAQHHPWEQGLWGNSHVQSIALWEGVSQ